MLKRALSHAEEFIYLYSTDLTPRTSDIWGPRSAHVASQRLFISWEPPPPNFLKVNFDDSVIGSSSGAAFVIRGPDSRLVATAGSHLFDSSVLEAELRAIWVGIAIARGTHQADRLVLEGDSSTVVGWI